MYSTNARLSLRGGSCIGRRKAEEVVAGREGGAGRVTRQFGFCRIRFERSRIFRAYSGIRSASLLNGDEFVQIRFIVILGRL